MSTRSFLIIGLATLLLGDVARADSAAPGGRRRTTSTVSVNATQRLTVYGDRVCPEGFTPLIVGNIFAFRQKGTDVPQFGGVDPACWKNPPFETDFLGQWTSVADCVVCDPAEAGSPTAPGTISPVGSSTGGTAVGGGGSAPVASTGR